MKTTPEIIKSNPVIIPASQSVEDEIVVITNMLQSTSIKDNTNIRFIPLNIPLPLIPNADIERLLIIKYKPIAEVMYSISITGAKNNKPPEINKTSPANKLKI